MSDFLTNINKLYVKKDYFDLYGGSFIVMLIIMMTFFVFFSYYWVLSNRTDIKKDWNSMKCHPGVIPFAGFINAPEGVNKTEYTKENFAGCLFNILKNITKVFTAPIQIIYTVLLNFFMTMLNSVNNIRQFQAFFLGIMGLQFESATERTYGTLTPLSMVIDKIGIIFKKLSMILTVFYFKIISILKLSLSLINLVLTLIVKLFTIALTLIILLWTFVWFNLLTWPWAVLGTSIYVSLLIIFIITVNSLNSMYEGIDLNVLKIIGTQDNEDVLDKYE
jgi:hypothetical protein